MTPDRYGPEISDLIVEYDPVTLQRRTVKKQSVLDRLAQEGHSTPLRIVRALHATDDGALDAAEVDGVLVRSHLELQRLHEEFRVGAFVRSLLAPLVEVVRAATSERPIRVVDIGCGLGFVSRWLSAKGKLGEDVEIIGADYNRALVDAANVLATTDGLQCRFVVANAFHLKPAAHIYISTGVLHHFRGTELTQLFAEQQSSNAFGFLHLDIRPSAFAPIGSWIFHQARMREPLAKWDGYWSAVRAHYAETLLAATNTGAPQFSISTIDVRPGLHAIVRIFQGLIGVRSEHAFMLKDAYSSFGTRVRRV